VEQSQHSKPTKYESEVQPILKLLSEYTGAFLKWNEEAHFFSADGLNQADVKCGGFFKTN
jgi:hypothetical protein